MINLMDSKISMDKVADALRLAMNFSDFPTMMVAMYENTINIARNDEMSLPEKVRVQFSIVVELQIMGNGLLILILFTDSPAVLLNDIPIGELSYERD